MALRGRAFASVVVLLLYLYEFRYVISTRLDTAISIEDFEQEEYANFLVKRGLYRDGCDCEGTCITHPKTGNQICICAPGKGRRSGYRTCTDFCRCGEGQVTCSLDNQGIKQCFCMIGYEHSYGRCYKKFDVCNPNRCHNGGTCVKTLENYTCDCPKTHTGPKCEIEIDPCEINQCENGGTCTKIDATSYTCDCPETHTGYFCENKVIKKKRPCDENPCKNGGTCWERPNGRKSYRCTCPPTYSGYNCEEDLNACDLNPCENGICYKGKGSTYLCICEPTHTGKNCEIAINPCKTKPCLNGGICWTGKGLEYICTCPPRYTGYNCKTAIRVCDANPCLNGGICWNGNGTEYVCSCPVTHTGKKCEIVIDPCESTPCKNGGTCFKGKNLNYTCICTSNFKGRDCEIVNNNKCDPNPCTSGGSCFELNNSNTYKCSCTKWYTGKNCTEDWWCSVGIGKYLCQKEYCSFDHRNQIGFCNGHVKTNERKLSSGSKVVSELAFDSGDMGSGMGDS